MLPELQLPAEALVAEITGGALDFYRLRKDSRTYPDEDDPDGNFPNRYEENAMCSKRPLRPAVAV